MKSYSSALNALLFFEIHRFRFLSEHILLQVINQLSQHMVSSETLQHTSSQLLVQRQKCRQGITLLNMVAMQQPTLAASLLLILNTSNSTFIKSNIKLFMLALGLKLTNRLIIYRSRHHKYSKKAVLKIIALFRGKQLYQILFLNKVASLSLQLHQKRNLGISVLLCILRNL